MSTISNFKQEDISAKNNIFSSIRVIIETAFYGNNVHYVKNLNDAYELAKKSLGTIVTDIDVYKSEDIGLNKGTKITNSELAATMGMTLTTKRTSAEVLKEGVDANEIVMEPYANPFRIYPLEEDFQKFRSLFKENNVDCYILNTGDFMGFNITPEVTLNCIESIILENAKFERFGDLPNLEIINMEGFLADFSDYKYLNILKSRFKNRIDFLKTNNEYSDFNKTSEVAIESLEIVYNAINKLL